PSEAAAESEAAATIYIRVPSSLKQRRQGRRGRQDVDECLGDAVRREVSGKSLKLVKKPPGPSRWPPRPRTVWGTGVASSNLAAPTNKINSLRARPAARDCGSGYGMGYRIRARSNSC